MTLVMMGGACNGSGFEDCGSVVFGGLVWFASWRVQLSVG